MIKRIKGDASWDTIRSLSGETLRWQKRTVGFCCMCKTKRETRPWTFPLQEIRTKQCFHLYEDEHGYRNVTKLKWNALRNLTHYLRQGNLTHILDKPTCRMPQSRPFQETLLKGAPLNNSGLSFVFFWLFCAFDDGTLTRLYLITTLSWPLYRCERKPSQL